AADSAPKPAHAPLRRVEPRRQTGGLESSLAATWQADQLFFFGTLAPFLRACDRPIAMACLRLLTFVPDLPLLSLPRLYSCIVFSTFLLAALPYFRAMRTLLQNKVRGRRIPRRCG